jgi:site-specific DNA recombinase
MTTIPKAFTSAFINKKSGITRVAIYCRVSSDEQVRVGGSLTDQERRLKLRAESEGWKIAEVFKDEGISGHTDERPALQRMMEACRREEIDLIIITQLDRLFRENRLQLNYVHELVETLGINLLTIDEGIDTRQGGYKIMLSFLGSMAEAEHDKIGLRVRKFRADRKEQKHQWSAGKPPYGYRFNVTTKQLEIYEPEAAAIREVFRLYTEEHIGQGKVAERMNQTAHPLPRTKRTKLQCWQLETVTHILHHPAYKGKSEPPYDDWAFNCPPIVTVETWDKAQAIADSNPHRKPSGDDGKDEFRGQMRCGQCGHIIRRGYNGNKKNAVYVCQGRLSAAHPDGSPRCALPRMKKQELDAQIHELIDNLCGSKESFIGNLEKNLAQLESEKNVIESNQKPISDEINAINEEMTILDARIEMRRIQPDDYKRRVKELQVKRDELEHVSDYQTQMTHQLEVNELEWKIAEYRGIIEAAQYSDFRELQETFRKYPCQRIYSNYLGRLFNSYKAFTQPNSYIFTIFPDHIDAKADIGEQRPLTPSCSR